VDFAVEHSIRKHNAVEIIEATLEVVSTFEAQAKALEINPESIKRISKAHLLKI
jgi:hypothetical protein